MRTFFVLMIAFCSVLSFTQEKETITQNRADQIGLKTKKDLKTAPHITWYNESYDNYTVDSKTIKKLRKHLNGVTIKVFMSVWCHDSHREIPQFYKIIEALNFDENKLKLVALDRSKKTPKQHEKGFDIQRTPTIIIFKNQKEIGRYVEKPRKSLEKDLLAILSGKKYKHSYEN